MPSLPKLAGALAKFYSLVTESRSTPRKPADSVVALAWRDGHGRITHASGQCVDISEMGARILYVEPIALPAVMQIRPESDGVLRTGHVRRCTPAGSQYEIGIEFCDPAAIQPARRGSPAS